MSRPVGVHPRVIASLLVVLSVGSARAQEKSTPTSRPGAESDDIRRELRAAQQAIEKLGLTCDACQDSGVAKNSPKDPVGPRFGPRGAPVRENSPQARAPQPCPRCKGFAGVSDATYQRFLDQYLSYCDLLDRHAEALAAAPKLAESATAKRDRYMAVIRRNVGLGVASGVVDPNTRRVVGGGEYNKPYQGLARAALTAKANPVGLAVAFEDRIEDVLDGSSGPIAEIAWPSGNQTLYCYVQVPRGIRWVRGARVVVVGKIIPVPTGSLLHQRDADPVLIKPYPGTE